MVLAVRQTLYDAERKECVGEREDEEGRKVNGGVRITVL